MKTPSLKTNQRAFTLFTALLSIVLILLAGLLVNTMINSERVSNQVVLEVEAQSRMQSLADLTRADALQVVNYGIRNAVEEYVQQSGNAYPYSQQALSWNQVKTDFSNFFFGKDTGETISGRIASNLFVLVQSQPKRIGGYVVSIEGGETPQLQAAIQEVLVKTAGASDAEFLQVVKCEEDTAPVDCVGTFYVNLDFSVIDDETYETLPSIHVFDETTGRELVEPVIPRGKFRIYVPLRIFKALKYAREIATGPLASGGGLLSPEFRANLGKLGVGMCDDVDVSGQVNCAYRTQPFTVASPGEVGPSPPVSPIQGGNLCPANQEGLGELDDLFPKNVPLVCDALAASLTGKCTAGQTITTYDPWNAVSRQKALQLLVSDVIGNKVDVLLTGIQEKPDFKLLTQELQIEPQVFPFTTKEIKFAGVSGVANAEGKCTKLVNTDVTLRFEETNLNYVVVDTRSPIIYQVRIVDAFSANLTKNTCVAYCLAQDVGGLGGVFIDPQLDGICAQTACAYEGKYLDPPAPPAPTCGDGSVNQPSEVCDPPSSTSACNIVSATFTAGTATCTASCQWDTSTCT